MYRHSQVRRHFCTWVGNTTQRFINLIILHCWIWNYCRAARRPRQLSEVQGAGKRQNSIYNTYFAWFKTSLLITCSYKVSFVIPKVNLTKILNTLYLDWWKPIIISTISSSEYFIQHDKLLSRPKKYLAEIGTKLRMMKGTYPADIETLSTRCRCWWYARKF